MDVSPDGAWIAYRTASPQENLFVMKSDGTGRRRLTDDNFRNRGPRWVRGSEWLVFYSNRGGGYGIWRTRPDGSDLSPLPIQPVTEVNQPIVSSDGSRIAITTSASEVPRLGVLGVGEGWFAPGMTPAPASVEFFADGFVANAWSLNGERIAGLAITPRGNTLAVYSFRTSRFEPRHELSGWTAYGMTWLPDSRRLLGWDALRNSAVVYDTESGETRAVTGIPGPAELRLTGDGRTLMVNRAVSEGDVWLLTLK